jgi:hypothetical protein
MKGAYMIVFLVCNITFPLLGQRNSYLSEKRDEYDSAQFHVGRLYFVTGRKCYESYTDTIGKLSYIKHYDPKGWLREEGFMDSRRDFHVGVWKYYSRYGRSKKVTFDSTAQISYYQAIQVAKSYEYSESKLAITEEFIRSSYYWKIIYWKEEDADGQTGEYILIRRKGGKVTKPKNNQVQSYY